MSRPRGGRRAAERPDGAGRHSWTSPLSAEVDLARVEGERPSAVSTSSAPESSIPAAVPSPPFQRTVSPCRASRCAPGRRAPRRPARPASASSASMQSLAGPVGVGLRVVLARGWCRRQVRAAGSTRSTRSRAPPTPPAAAPRRGCRPACCASIQMSLGHLIRHSSSGADSQVATAAASGRISTGSRTTRDMSTAEPGRRGPAAALAAAPGGLLVGGHERAVRRARLGELLGPLVGRVGQAEMEPREPETAHRGRRRTSPSGARPNVPAASPRLIATARLRYASSYTISSPGFTSAKVCAYLAR